VRLVDSYILFFGDQRLSPGACDAQNCQWGFPKDYSFSITQLPGNSGASVVISMMLSIAGYAPIAARFEDAAGGWDILNALNGTTSHGSFDATISNTIGMSLKGRNVTFSLNGQVVAQNLMPSDPIATTVLEIDVRTQADISNFVFTPLS
jgi:hypothetical protein